MGARERFEVLGQSTAAVQPSYGAFDDPSARQHLKSSGRLGSLDDFQSDPCCPTHRAGCLLALVSAIRDHPLQKGKEPPHRLQNTQAAITILHVPRQNGAAEHQAERVHNRVALAPFDPLGRIIAHRIDRASPLSAPFTLWMSTMAVVGLASLSTISRTCS